MSRTPATDPETLRRICATYTPPVAAAFHALTRLASQPPAAPQGAEKP